MAETETERAPSTRRPRRPAPARRRSVHPDVVAAQARDMLTLLLFVRAANTLLQCTFFQPDEYYQALEPAWAMAFGRDSGAWLTWEWHHQLRSSLHPALFAAVYAAADALMTALRVGPHARALVLTALPKTVQAVLAALGDLFTWKLAGRVYGQQSRAAWAALWMTIFNPWQWYCSTRTFSNSLEATLTIMALYYWPWPAPGPGTPRARAQGRRLSLLLAAAAVVLRPTNLLVWLAVLAATLARMAPLSRAALAPLARDAALCGAAVLAVAAVADRAYFGFWAFPPYAWLHFNVGRDLAVFYGRNPWHYYLSQGLPLLTTTLLPFALVGLCRSAVLRADPVRPTLALAVLTSVGALSLVSHKEVRFIYPLLPVLHVLAAPHVAWFFTVPPRPAVFPPPPPRIARRGVLAALVTVNVAIALFLSRLHQPAPLSVLAFLRAEYERLHPDRLGQLASPGPRGDELFALFLTPCHSTPWRSHLIYPSLRARALTCEPPLHTAPRSPERAAYLDEANRFYAAATADGGAATSWGADFLSREMWPLLPPPPLDEDGPPRRGGEVPRYIVGFEGIEDMLLGFFDGPARDMGVDLRRVWVGWNGFFNEDWRRRGHLVVWDTGMYPGVDP